MMDAVKGGAKIDIHGTMTLTCWLGWVSAVGLTKAGRGNNKQMLVRPAARYRVFRTIRRSGVEVTSVKQSVMKERKTYRYKSHTGL